MKTPKRTLLRNYFPEEKGLIPGWGRKKSATRAKILASLTFRQPVFLEDGFLRSFKRSDRPLSIVADRKGIYYDAKRPSQLEELINTPLGKRKIDRARKIIDAWVASGASKYNHLPDPETLPEGPYVLLMDQVHGDSSIAYGLGSPEAFTRMLDDAMKLFPNHRIVIKVHPDVVSGKKEGHFDLDELAGVTRIEILGDATHPVEYIRHAEAVFTVTSQTGFEALMHSVPVYCYGMPFYAGWGLTHDRALASDPGVAEAKERRSPVLLEALVHAALVDYPSYMDPHTGALIQPEAAIEMIRRHRERLAIRKGTIHAIGFSQWKKPILRRFLAPAHVVFHETQKSIQPGNTVALWGAHGTEHIPLGCKIIRIEDGFIRSKGLGVELTTPSSWVIDDIGIYFDSTRPSRMENILQNEKFTQEVIQQGRAVREEIISSGMTKYNLAGKKWSRPKGSKAKHVVLVPGQVESDASIRLGSPEIKTNLDLIKSVRAMHPNDYIVYKPHPDVVSGYRSKGSTEDEIHEYCDEVVVSGDLLEMFKEVDELHTITSLSGFEALIRDLPVTCHGQPFYSGWGLTRDLISCARRKRKLSLDELVSAALISYPDYVSRRSGEFINALAAIEEIKAYKPGLAQRLPFRRHFIRWAARLGEKKREAQAK